MCYEPVLEGLRLVQADESGLLIDLRHTGLEVLAIEQPNVHGDPGLLGEPEVVTPSGHA